MCQSPKERLLQLESIFALGISITGLQSSASLIMDSHMALLTHTVLSFSFSLLVLRSNFSHFFSLSLFFYFILFFTYYLSGHILFFYKHPSSLSVLRKSLDMTHHTEL